MNYTNNRKKALEQFRQGQRELARKNAGLREKLKAARPRDPKNDEEENLTALAGVTGFCGEMLLNPEDS